MMQLTLIIMLSSVHYFHYIGNTCSSNVNPSTFSFDTYLAKVGSFKTEFTRLFENKYLVLTIKITEALILKL